MEGREAAEATGTISHILPSFSATAPLDHSLCRYNHITAPAELFFPGSILWLPRFEHLPGDLQELRKIQRLRPGCFSHPFMVLEKPDNDSPLVKALIVTTFSHGGPPRVGEKTRYRCEIEDFLPIAPTQPDPDVASSFQLQLGSPWQPDSNTARNAPKLQMNSWINVMDIFEIPKQWLGELFAERLMLSIPSLKRLFIYRRRRLQRLRQKPKVLTIDSLVRGSDDCTWPREKMKRDETNNRYDKQSGKHVDPHSISRYPCSKLLKASG